VLERGYVPGIGNTIRLYLADPNGLRRQRRSGADQRPPTQLIHKTLLADLGTAPRSRDRPERQVNPLLDNVEGLTVTGRDRTALRLLLVSDDNRAPTRHRLYTLTTHSHP